VNPTVSTLPTMAEREASFPEDSLLFRLSVVVLRRRLLIGRLSLVCGILVLIVTLAQPRHYTATSSFLPQSSNKNSSLAGLAAQFGVAVAAGSDAAQSPAFYSDLLRSRSILQQVVQSPYELAGTARGGRMLTDVFEVTGDSATRLYRAIERLRKSIKTNVSSTGVVRLDVRASRPDLAQRVNERLLDAITRFNLERRQSQAAAERRFTGRRLEEISASLHAAEYALAEFHQQNRGMLSPLLRLQEDRLQRAVGMQQQIYTTIAESHEQAKIEEVRDTPVLTIVEQPVAPVGPDSRDTIIRTLLGVIFGAVMGMSLALVLEGFSQLRSREEDTYGELVALRSDLLADLRRPWRLIYRSRRDVA